MQGHQLVGSESMQTVGVARIIHKLDLEGIVRQQFNDGSDFTGDETQIRHVANQSNRVQKMNCWFECHFDLLIG